MTTIESLEHAVARLSPADLAAFRAGSPSSMPRHGTHRLKPTLERESSTFLPPRHSQSMKLERLVKFETFHIQPVLALLRRPAC